MSSDAHRRDPLDGRSHRTHRLDLRHRLRAGPLARVKLDRPFAYEENIMERLLPAPPVLARWRRRIEALPHGLPTALTFTISVAALALGSMFVAGVALPGHPRPDSDEALTGPEATASPGASTAAVQPSDAPEAPRSSDTTAGAGEAVQPGTSRRAPAAGDRSQGMPDVDESSHLGHGDHGGQDGPESTGTPRGDDHDTARRSPRPSQVPDDDHDGPRPSSRPRSEDQHASPSPSPSPSPDREPDPGS